MKKYQVVAIKTLCEIAVARGEHFVFNDVPLSPSEAFEVMLYDFEDDMLKSGYTFEQQLGAYARCMVE